MGRIKLEVNRDIGRLDQDDYYISCDLHFAQNGEVGEYIETLFEFSPKVPEVGTVFLRDIDDAPDDCATQLTTHDDSGVSDKLELMSKIDGLGVFERKIIETQVDRLLVGRTEYGTWSEQDGRDLPHEALEEVLDALNYVAAMLGKGK